MGCDIHMHVEHHTSAGWVRLLPPPDSYQTDDKEWDWDRFYRSFAYLAGVRNYREPIVRPLAEPRGLPADVSAEVRAAREGWADDGHSASWCSLAELKAKPPHVYEDETYPGSCVVFAALIEKTYPDYKPEDVRCVYWFDN